jgi:hypothetical protein
MNWKNFLAAGAMILFTGNLYATTPDGDTPSQESSCDSESGAAFGLCVAYCQAMDCDSVQKLALENACLTVRDRFVQLAGRDLPCEEEKLLCPCSGMPQWDAYLESGDWDECRTGPTGGWDDMFRLINTTTSDRAFSGLLRADGRYRCLSYTPLADGWIGITSEEEEACEAELQAAADAFGTICTAW